MWAIGGPPRIPAILVTAVTGLVVRKASFFVKMCCFVAAMTYSVLAFIGSVFSLHIASLLYSIRFMLELRPSASIEYVALFGLIVVMVAFAWRMLRMRSDFARTQELLLAIVLTVSFAAVDFAATYGSRGSYMRMAPHGAVFSSAARQADLPAIATGRHNLLIVVVEAMGLPSRPELRNRLLGRWNASDIRAHYDVTMGETPFYGSTTSAEIRELCGRWGDYPEFMQGFHAECLPARLAGKGYRTTAIHSFSKEMFERQHWYPRIGFQRMIFSDDLVRMGTKRCPGVFAGACDPDVLPIISDRLKQPGPQFVYWLTVNTHVPVPESAELGNRGCERFDRALARDHAMICRMAQMWEELNDVLAETLVDPELPPTDVLIVGDHTPPFFARNQRDMFDSERVPWILLKHRDARGALRE
jgi:hypothetical protein